jgi:hypothetical protein
MLMLSALGAASKEPAVARRLAIPEGAAAGGRPGVSQGVSAAAAAGVTSAGAGGAR